MAKRTDFAAYLQALVDDGTLTVDQRVGIYDRHVQAMQAQDLVTRAEVAGTIRDLAGYVERDEAPFFDRGYPS